MKVTFVTNTEFYPIQRANPPNAVCKEISKIFSKTSILINISA